MTGVTGNLFSHRFRSFYLTMRCIVHPIFYLSFQLLFIVSKSISKCMNNRLLLLPHPRRSKQGEEQTIYVGPTCIQKSIFPCERKGRSLYEKEKVHLLLHYLPSGISVMASHEGELSNAIKKVLPKFGVTN